MDVALLSQALHHAAVARHARSPKPRASSSPAAACCCSSCAATRSTWVRERLGDKWLGFDDDELKRLLADAGLTDIKVTVGARRARDPFTVLIASGVKTETRHGPAQRPRSHKATRAHRHAR